MDFLIKLYGQTTVMTPRTERFALSAIWGPSSAMGVAVAEARRSSSGLAVELALSRAIAASAPRCGKGASREWRSELFATIYGKMEAAMEISSQRMHATRVMDESKTYSVV